MKKFFKSNRRSKHRGEAWQKPELDGTEIQIPRTDLGTSGSANTAAGFVDLNDAFARAKSSTTCGGGPSAQEVITHEGFGSWLSTFQPTAVLSDEHQRNMERLNDLALAEAVPAPALPLHPPPDPTPRPQPVEGEPENYTIVFEGPRADLGDVEVSLPPDTHLASVVEILKNKGFKEVLGFVPNGAGDLAIAPWIDRSNAYTIRVTSGPSCYSFAKGYRINRHESFISFFNATLSKSKPVAIKIEDHKLAVDGGKISISFQRSLRVPETRKAFDLPPGLGRFPLFNVKDFEKRMPGNMAAKGGVCMPLFQREAMWIDFDYQGKKAHHKSSPQYAIKVFVGGVNAISGKTWDKQTKQKQDYIVVPPQPWLDGITAGPGVVKQFIAMPLGSGYSVEQQVTGKEDIGGIQMEIVPVYNSKFKISPRCIYHYSQEKGGVDKYYPPDVWSKHDSPDMMGCDDGARIFLEDCQEEARTKSRGVGLFRDAHYDLPVDEAWDNPSIVSNLDSPSVRPATLRDLLDLSPQEHGLHKPLVVKTLGLFYINIEHDGTLQHPPQNPFVAQCSPFALLPQLLKSVEKSTAKQYQYRHASYQLKYDGAVLDEKRTVWEHGIRNGSKLTYCCLPYQPQWDAVRSLAPYASRRAARCSGSIRGPLWDMGIAAGGLISQKLHRDPHTHPSTSYNTAQARTLNIQMLNSIAFEACTGMLTPETPITAANYVAAGLPFYRIYEESPGIAGGLEDIRSVGSIDAQGSVGVDVSISAGKPTGCARCGARLVDCILRKCNHAFCSECVHGKMTGTDGAIICAFCRKRAELLIGVSAPMPMPGEEEVVMTNVVVLHEGRTAEIG